MVVKKKPGRPKKLTPVVVPKRKAGRPRKTTPPSVPGPCSKYDPVNHPKKALKLLSNGMAQDMLAYHLDVHPTTLVRWKHRYPEFADAVAEGITRCDEDAQASLYKCCVGYTDKDGRYHPPDWKACRAWLYNRRPRDWADKKEVKADINISDLSEDEIVDKIKALIDSELNT